MILNVGKKSGDPSITSSGVKPPHEKLGYLVNDLDEENLDHIRSPCDLVD
jgi:hypothetical protein